MYTHQAFPSGGVKRIKMGFEKKRLLLLLVVGRATRKKSGENDHSHHLSYSGRKVIYLH